MIKKKKNNKIVWISVSIIVAIAASAAGLYFGLRNTAPDPKTAEPMEVVNYLTSESFGNMSIEKRQNYLDRLRQPHSDMPIPSMRFDRSQLTKEQRLELMKNIMPVVAPRIRQRLEEFEQLSQAEKTARLDALIDSFERNGNSPNDMDPQQVSVFLEYMDPYTRSSIRKHLPALLGRMAQRGLGDNSTATPR